MPNPLRTLPRFSRHLDATTANDTLFVWRDDYAGVIFVSLDPTREATHRWLPEFGIGLRYDALTDECIGFVIVVGLTDRHPVALPLAVIFALLVEMIAEGSEDD